MKTATQIVDALGGTVAVANELDLAPTTVSSWKKANSIPKWRMPGVKDIAARKGINLAAPTSSEAA